MIARILGDFETRQLELFCLQNNYIFHKNDLKQDFVHRSNLKKFLFYLWIPFTISLDIRYKVNAP